MARTFLQAVNLTLRRVGMISSDLSTFSDTARQMEIDAVKQAWNEVIDDLQGMSAWPTQIGEGTVTLASGTKGGDASNYAVASDFDGIAPDPSGRPVMRDETNGRLMYEYPGGWHKMRREQLIPSNYSGTPTRFALSPVNGTFELDVAPGAADAGNVYKYLYHKRVTLDATTDTFPIRDDAVDTLIPAVVIVYNEHRKGHDQGSSTTQIADRRKYERALARAARKIRQIPARDSYGPRVRDGASAA